MQVELLIVEHGGCLYFSNHYCSRYCICSDRNKNHVKDKEWEDAGEYREEVPLPQRRRGGSCAKVRSTFAHCCHQQGFSSFWAHPEIFPRDYGSFPRRDFVSSEVPLWLFACRCWSLSMRSVFSPCVTPGQDVGRRGLLCRVGADPFGV